MYSPAEIQHLANWAAQECSWQMSGEKSVARLIDAALTAHDWYLPGQLEATLSLGRIIHLAHMLEPKNNQWADYRKAQVFINFTEMPSWKHVPRLMHDWIDAARGVYLTPTQAFKAFEEIHPFIDGNGRTGAIIYNWLNGTLHPGDLAFPPNVFADSRREGITL